MKKTLTFLMTKTADPGTAAQPSVSYIEVLSDDEALQVRGGDKDFTPVTSSDGNKNAKISTPFLLVNC